jgi:hypothetical protein
MLLQVHSGTTKKNLGSTWVGATHCSAVAATAHAVLVAPTHVLSEDQSSTVPVLKEYQPGPQLRPGGE